MQALAYEGPDGELTIPPSLDSLRGFLDLGPDYWQGGSGSGYIGWVQFRNPGYRLLSEYPILHVLTHAPYGFCLMYAAANSTPGTMNRVLMSYNEAAPDDLLVEHFLGGEPAYFPSRSFVRREAAEGAIDAFLKAQVLPSEIAWKPRRAATYDGYAFAPEAGK